MQVKELDTVEEYSRESRKNTWRVVVIGILTVIVIVLGVIWYCSEENTTKIKSNTDLNTDYKTGAVKEGTESIKETRGKGGSSPKQGVHFKTWNGEEVTGEVTTQYWKLEEEYEDVLCNKYSAGDSRCLYYMVKYVGDKDGYKDYAYMVSEGKEIAFSVGKKDGHIWDNASADSILNPEYGCQEWLSKYGIIKITTNYQGQMSNEQDKGIIGVLKRGGYNLTFTVSPGVDGYSIVKEWAKNETKDQYFGGMLTVTVGERVFGVNRDGTVVAK